VLEGPHRLLLGLLLENYRDLFVLATLQAVYVILATLNLPILLRRLFSRLNYKLQTLERLTLSLEGGLLDFIGLLGRGGVVLWGRRCLNQVLGRLHWRF
jgi:hypothetical protein